MSESDLTPEELKEVELLIPAIDRKNKLDARRKLFDQMKGPHNSNPGGISSKLDPINPHKLKEYGTPTVPVKIADIKLPHKN